MSVTVIHEYTRAEAIDDGNLVDVSEMAAEAGLKYPVALTYAAWARYVEVPEDVQGEQDEQGRLWDILTMFVLAARESGGGGGNRILFRLAVRNRKTERPEIATLKAICGPGDNSEPVVTIMLPGED